MSGNAFIEAWHTLEADGRAVHVREDNDLELRFKRGDVIPANQGDIHVAMILGVDGEDVDVISVSGGGLEPAEILASARSAITRALDALED